MNELQTLLTLISCLLLGVAAAKLAPVELSAKTHKVHRRVTPTPVPTVQPKTHGEENTSLSEASDVETEHSF